MPDKLILLVREVERLVTAPYAPSLQDLHNIVQHTSSTVISSWASCKLCQVGALVDVLVDGLSRSRVALPLLRAFAPVPAFRNALLERYPAVLDNFLEKAVENEEPEHFSACIALLSSPLPPDFIAPARLAPFVMKLIVKMGERPCAETMLPLYRLMTGLQTSPRTLYDVPFEILSSLQMELTKTLRNLDDHMGNLLCLATFARIASSQQINSEKEHGPDSLYWKLNINHLFGPRRGAKILDLVVKRVVFACSSGCSGFTSNEVAESVRLAIEICDSVEPEQKQTWIAASSSKVTIAKLFEKVTRDGIDHGVQMMGVTFLASLLPPAFLSQEILALGLQGLLSDDSKHVLEVIPCELIPRLVEANVIYSGELIISKLFDYVFSALKVKSSSSSGSIATVQVASSITFALQRLQSQQWASVILEVARSQYAERIGELLETFPEQSCQSRCESSNICHAAMSMHEKKLLVNFIGLYSGALLQHNAEDDVPDPIESRILTFFMNQVKTNLAQNKCSFSTSKPFDFRGSFSSLQIREDSSDSYQRRDWRTGIADTLMLNARASHKNMMKKVEEVCQDLEDRCYDTETPLRIVVEEREQLSVKTEQLKNRNQELETQTQHASITIANLQQTIAQLEHHAEISSAQFEELSATLEAARSELEEQRHNSQETTQSEREKARTRELGLIATMAEKDQHLEELQDEIREQREENDETRRILDTVSKEKAACLEESVLLKQEISRLEQSTEANRLISAQKDDEIQQLLADKESSIMEIKALQQRVDGEMSESNSVRSALKNAEENFRAETDSLRKQNESELSQVVAECAKQREENKALQATMQTAASNATKELQTKEKRIQYLEKKVQSMRDERAAKAREFSEAQQHISRLMGVMGFKANPVEPEASNKHQRPRSNLGPSQAATMRQKANAGEDDDNTQAQVEHSPAESFEPNTPCSTGRNPKRSKGNPWSLDPSPVSHKAGDRRSKDLSSPSHTRQRPERYPLGDADQNSQLSSQQSSVSSHRQSGIYQESQDCTNPDENRLQDIDLDMDLESSKDFIFTSTSLSEANDHLLARETQQ